MKKPSPTKTKETLNELQHVAFFDEEDDDADDDDDELRS